MPDQHGFGDNRTEATRPRQPGQGPNTASVSLFLNVRINSGTALATRDTTF
jgi:hypothetical protein